MINAGVQLSLLIKLCFILLILLVHEVADGVQRNIVARNGEACFSSMCLIESMSAVQ